MSTLAREGTQSLRATVRVAESVCALPAVATQDWCDRAAAALLPIVGAGVCVTLIGQVDDRGVIQRHEATGVAGCVLAEITTTVGRPSTGTSVVMLDPNDAGLARVRTNLAQARELSWAIGNLPVGATRVGTSANPPTPASSQAILRRWDAVPNAGVLLGAVALGADGRMLIVELAPTPGQGHLGESEQGVLEAVLPLLARRAVLAIGGGPAESAHWLTQREQIILQHLLLGKSVREIAEELGRSPHTVHDHVKSLHRKLNASSRGELVARALGYVEMKPSNAGTTGMGSSIPGETGARGL